MTYLRRAIVALVLIAGFGPAIAQVPPPVPALPDTERRTSYSITSSTCTCNVNFALFGDGTDFSNWVEVFLNGIRVNYNDATFGWTITSPTGQLANIARPVTDGVLTFAAAQTGTVQIVGARRPRRVSQFNENQGVPARNLNQAITDIIAMLRENWDKTNDVTGRAVLGNPGETLALLPLIANRKSMGACFDSNGNLTSCISVPSSTFSAGTGITFTGTNPTSISVTPVTIPNNNLYGNVSGGTAAPTALTPTQATTLCNVFTTTLSGCVPAAGAGSTKVLFQSGWAVIPSVSYGAAVNLGGTNEQWIPPATNLYHLFIANTVVYNQSSLFVSCCGSVGAAFVPATGAHLVHLVAQVWATSGVAATGNMVAKWIKNANVDGNHNLVVGAGGGTDVCAGIGNVSDFGTGTAIMRADCYDQPSPGDYYNLFMFIDSTTLGTTAIVVDSNIAHTYVQAAVIY